ncbi:hypothetical protein [Chamaesiphon polymorphus]|uniref:Uncharacterized protein n=1 Tax=Chamaesiphon polymorphus CCALA 037 TaxID=2107692 RepID=A0A2T1GMX9_9CYAN|nr:hypothetical protein [Chamaesiphon polymorphus]PSB59165.1 hypothetical protein C7B77_01885 [Chamaesiphon polymorphus CCALA 037]
MTIDYHLNDSSIKFKNLLIESVSKWFDLVLEKQHEQAKKICNDFIAQYGSQLKNLTFSEAEDEYNLLFISLVFVKSLHDYNQLLQITENVTWHQDRFKVECAWIKLCDCRERIEYSSQCFKGQVVKEIIKHLDDLEVFFPNVFEEGNYISPGIIVDKYLCNICNEDTRNCCHISGKLYDGKICSYQQINPRIDHVALVKVPRDPRCRIWPWNIRCNNDGKVTGMTNIPIIISGGMSDFLDAT